MPGMDDAWVRIKRAQANLKRFQDELTVFRDTHQRAYAVRAEHDRKGNVRLIAVIGQRPPNEWGLASGDILVDLRTALDYAVYALAVKGSGQPIPPFADKLEFPIKRDGGKWSEVIGRHMLANVPPLAIEFIQQEQPYQPANVGTDVNNAALAVLEDLVGINKHRFIHLFVVQLHALQLPMELLNLGVEIVGRKLEGELKDGTVLATLKLTAKAKYARIQIKPSLTTYIGFEPIAPGRPSHEVNYLLTGLSLTVEHYVREMERHLA